MGMICCQISLHIRFYFRHSILLFLFPQPIVAQFPLATCWPTAPKAVIVNLSPTDLVEKSHILMISVFNLATILLHMPFLMKPSSSTWTLDLY